MVNFHNIKRYWPPLLAAIILFITITVVLLISINKNQGHLIYVLDDAYIHMAIAKNLSQYGIWGVTKYGFSS
ncbi:MAG: hypothetical protein ACE5QV_05600, partial [Fidelibacterota bacterium]